MPSTAPCTLLLKPTSDSFDVNECRKALETGSEKAKIEAMSNLLHAVAVGEACGSLVMHVIRFVMPNQKNKFLKKLVLLFFEMVPKVDSDGKLLQEMILLWYRWSGTFPLVAHCVS
jgi:coatomer subunit beta